MRMLKLVLIVGLVFYLLMIFFLYLAQESIIFQPVRLDQDHQFSFNHQYEEFNLTMEDGAVLNAVHFKVDNPNGVILYFHGNAGNLASWGFVAEDFVELGYNVIIMDYRQYGKSTGDWSYSNFLRDADEFYRYTQSIYPENEIVVYGRSLGSGFASWVASGNNPRMLILESSYTSIADMGKLFYPIAPVRQLVRFNFRPAIYLKQANCPIYLIHGTHDMIVPYTLGEKLHHKLKPDINAELITIEEGGHNDLSDFPQFKVEIKRILE